MATGDVKLLISALVDRIIYGDPGTFSAADAREVLTLIPRSGGWRRFAGSLPAVQVRHSTQGAGTSGVAAGIGSVRLPGGNRLAELDLDGRLCVRAGQWRIYRAERLLDGLRGIERIEIVQAATTGRISGSGGMLIYRAASQSNCSGGGNRRCSADR